MTVAEMLAAIPKFQSRRLLRSQHFRTAHCVNFGGVLALAAVERKEPSGAMVRYNGRLTTPSTCPHIARLSSLSRCRFVDMEYFALITLALRSAHPLGDCFRTLRGLPGCARQICPPELSANSRATHL